MTAISKSFVVIADGAVDPDSPIDNALVQGLRDNDVHLREWIGASYTAGAVQNHSHDGVDSALVPIGANAVRNGSFESGTGGWTIVTNTGGTVAINTANAMDGANCLAFTSTSTANGGGSATSQEYIPCAAGLSYSVKALVLASVANVSSALNAIWYDSAHTQVSESNAYITAASPTVMTEVGADLVAPATAKFMRVKLYGGVPGSGSATGTIYFDQVVVQKPAGLLRFTTITASDAAWVPLAATRKIVVHCIGGGGAGGGIQNGNAASGLGGKCGAMSFGSTTTITATFSATIGAGGTGVSAAAGYPGGTTSFGAVASAVGGIGGSVIATAEIGATLSIPSLRNGEGLLASGGTETSGGTGGAAAANSGAGGGAAYSAVTSYAGGAGGSGIIYVWEYA